MNRLVSNGVHLLKRAGHLVRTPIRIKLNPDARAYYSVSGSYNSNNWPGSGFIAQSTYDNCWSVGYDCLRAYISPNNPLQIWRSVTTSHDPETCWYQGAFATSETSIERTFMSCEAYIQLGAYHFTIPEGLRGLNLTGATVSFTNGGGIECYQSAGLRSSHNRALKGRFNFTTNFLPFYAVTSLKQPRSVMAAPYDAAVDIYADGGGFVGLRDLWGFTGTSRDGAIPTLTSPATKTFRMSESTLSVMRAGNGAWIVPADPAYVNSARNYGPYYVNSYNGYWACESVWGLKMEVELS